jgi:hypothetical protein
MQDGAIAPSRKLIHPCQQEGKMKKDLHLVIASFPFFLLFSFYFLSLFFFPVFLFPVFSLFGPSASIFWGSSGGGAIGPIAPPLFGSTTAVNCIAQ